MIQQAVHASAIPTRGGQNIISKYLDLGDPKWGGGGGGGGKFFMTGGVWARDYDWEGFSSETECRGGSRGGGLGGCNPPKPRRPTVNSAQELKFIVHYARRVQYKLSAKRKPAYPVRGAVEPRLLNQSDITCVYVNRQ